MTDARDLEAKTYRETFELALLDGATREQAYEIATKSIESFFRDDARHMDELIAIGEALGAPDGSTGAEILEVARETIRRIEAMGFLLRHHLPKCGGCSALATRTYIHTSGHRCYACDDDGCMTEHFCSQCRQVSVDPSKPCAFCGHRETQSRVTAWTISDLPFADLRRKAGVTER